MISSVQTLKLTSSFGPNVCVIGTSQRIAPLRDQDAPLPRHVVAGIEGVPAAADDRPRTTRRNRPRPRAAACRRRSDTRCNSARDVHAAAERNGEVRIVAADALALLVSLPRGLGGARMLVAEGDVAVNEIADRLHPRPAERRLLEQLARRSPKAGRSRNSGCRADRPACPRAAPRSCAERPRQTPGPAGPLSRTTPSAARRMRPAGATMRLHQLPNTSR